MFYFSENTTNVCKVLFLVTDDLLYNLIFHCEDSLELILLFQDFSVTQAPPQFTHTEQGWIILYFIESRISCLQCPFG